MKLITNDKALLMAAPALLRGRSLGRYRTLDTAIAFRMGMGFPGDVNRGHPASIQPALNSPINPITLYGQPCVVDTAGGANAGVRPLSVGDGALTSIWGVVVRPYPIQQATTSNQSGAVPYGAVAPPTQQPVDVIRGGYVMVTCGVLNGAPAKGGAVFIWIAASGGGHVQGGFEGAASGGNTIALDVTDYSWNSPADSNGVAELILNKF
jgi:hypothetical protein